MEDQANGYIYEIASPLELGVASHRDQALIVWRHQEDAETAPLVSVIPPEELTQVLWKAGLLRMPQPEKTTP